MGDLLEDGQTISEIARRLGLSKPAICHHARRLGYPPSVKFVKRYDRAEVQRYYGAGHTVRQCRQRFGFANQTWNSAVKRGDVVARPHGRPLEDYLVAERLTTSRERLKIRLVRTGLKNGCCEECGLREWRGRRLSLALHHVNGDRDDDRLENLALLCPNCHGQTDNSRDGTGVARGERLPPETDGL